MSSSAVIGSNNRPSALPAGPWRRAWRRLRRRRSAMAGLAVVIGFIVLGLLADLAYVAVNPRLRA